MMYVLHLLRFLITQFLANANQIYEILFSHVTLAPATIDGTIGIRSVTIAKATISKLNSVVGATY